ncbi:glycosyltransferase [Wenzhouxiangella sp. XN79A]|uniref:glycosyltransferase n=1 Tax=Wenzhouxiangella sp. XN79A TaxID=2724193 RepID=UPI00144AC6E9|nr:glycosyltransferase [Wenzhouxiangella sp. XN79A]NKI36427.1 glycosyltransferase [Wenzhouxiangella sp. XN79A]
MQVIHVNQSDALGGAAKAAARIHDAVRENGVDSCLLVAQSLQGDPATETTSNRSERLSGPVRRWMTRGVTGLLKTGNVVAHEPALFSNACARQLRNSGADIAHLHWVSDNMLSIRAIAQLPMPVIWTLHDMWAFCGAEHYADDTRWRAGYARHNRPPHEGGLDLNRWVWARKRRLWKRPMHIVAPSCWLADLAQRSALMADWPIEVIPNAIDTNDWAPVDKRVARQALGLPDDVPLVLFGAMGGGADPRKGFDLLEDALGGLSAETDLDIMLLVFGGGPNKEAAKLEFPARYLGHLGDDLSLRLVYSAADMLVIPSRLDNLPNTGVEALACGTPLVGFDVGGMSDLILHKGTGYLARAQDGADLARGIRWVLAQRRRDLSTPLGSAARLHAETKFAAPVVAEQYRRLYASVLETNAAVPSALRQKTSS